MNMIMLSTGKKLSVEDQHMNQKACIPFSFTAKCCGAADTVVMVSKDIFTHNKHSSEVMELQTFGDGDG